MVHAKHEFTGLTNETFGLSLAAIGAKEIAFATDTYTTVLNTVTRQFEGA